MSTSYPHLCRAEAAGLIAREIQLLTNKMKKGTASADELATLRQKRCEAEKLRLIKKQEMALLPPRLTKEEKYALLPPAIAQAQRIVDRQKKQMKIKKKLERKRKRLAKSTDLVGKDAVEKSRKEQQEMSHAPRRTCNNNHHTGDKSEEHGDADATSLSNSNDGSSSEENRLSPTSSSERKDGSTILKGDV